METFLRALSNKRYWPYYGAGAACLLILCLLVLYFIVTGKTRREPTNPLVTTIELPAPATNLVTRRLDGVMVPAGQDTLLPRAVMIDNQVDARPWSGVADASIVIESPVEGGITRLMAVFDGATTSTKIGPVRSARPYFVEWARGFNAAYFHVGGSPDALDLLKTVSTPNLDEMAHGNAFWRATDRSAPHNAYTSGDRMLTTLQDMDVASTTVRGTWHFQDMASSTARGGAGSVRVPYGGSYSISWRFDPVTDVYTRYISNKSQLQEDGQSLTASNVIVMKTDAQVLDEKGRLRLRTTGSGQAILYRDGNKYPVRWRRSANEQLSFEGEDGREILLTRGKTWVQVVTDDTVFAGL